MTHVYGQSHDLRYSIKLGDRALFLIELYDECGGLVEHYETDAISYREAVEFAEGEAAHLGVREGYDEPRYTLTAQGWLVANLPSDAIVLAD